MRIFFGRTMARHRPQSMRRCQGRAKPDNSRGGDIGSKWVANRVSFTSRCCQNHFVLKVGRVAEWFKAAVLKTARGLTLPRGFESHPFRQDPLGPYRPNGI